MVGALLDILDDKNDDVKKSVKDALKKISNENPQVVIHASVYYWEMHTRLSRTHVSSLLKIMMETCTDELAKLDDDLAVSLAELAVTELTRDCEKDATDLLVALSRIHCTQSMGGLLNKFQPDIVPTCSIIKAMGMIASCNPFGMVPFIKLTLSVMLPMLAQAHDDMQKQAFCFVLGKFAEAINDYIMNLDEAPDPGIGKDAFIEEMSKAFDVLTNNWLKTSKHIHLAESILTALCPIIPLLPEDDAASRTAKLIPCLLAFFKYQDMRLSATRVLAMLLNCTTEESREVVRPFLESMQHSLFDLIIVTAYDPTKRYASLIHYEVLQCFRSIVVLYPEEGLDRLLQHLKTPTGTQRARALVVLRHLVNTLPPGDDASLQRIALSLQNSLGEGSTRQLVGAIVALAAHSTLPLLPSQRAAFIQFMVLRCAAPNCANDDSQAYEEALFLLATTVDGAENWLWPSLIKSLLDQTYTASAVPVLRSLSVLAVKIIRADNSDYLYKDKFSGTKVLARCLELMNQEKNRQSVIMFLRSSAPLLGHQLKPEWDGRLLEISKIIETENSDNWQELMIEFLEKSVELEGNDWADKLSKELVNDPMSPGVAPYLAAVTNDQQHLTNLIYLSKCHPFNEEYSKAVGIAAKRYLKEIIDLMEVACGVEDSRKNPTRLLGLVRDSKAAASAEATKATLLKCYAEICRRGEPSKLFSYIENFILPWIVKQLNECKETTSKEAGLIALEQVGGVVHPNRLSNSTGLTGRSTGLATLLNLLQSHTGYRPLQLYPAILTTIISLLRIPPVLNPDERHAVLSTVLDKVIGASTEVDLILPVEEMQRVVNGLAIVCSEIIGDSADGLADLIEILMPWMQSKSSIERNTTLCVLRTSLTSYHDSLKYTYPGGKLEPGKLLGRILSWSADPECMLRPIVVECVALTLGIGSRHRSALPDNNLTQDLSESKKAIVSSDINVLYSGIKTLSSAACERIASGEVVSLAVGLIEGLLFRGENGLAAGIGLTQVFQIRGGDIPRSDLYLVDNIIGQMRQMENSSCRRTAAGAIKALTIHHLDEVIEHLLHQPLPPDRGTEECWKELGSEESYGLKTLDFLIKRLENNPIFAENTNNQGNNPTASFPSLSAIVSLRHLLQSSTSERLIEKRLAELLSILLNYMSGWLHVDAPLSVISTKFGFVPNREACKLSPRREVYSVLTNVLTVVNINVASSLLNETFSDTDIHADENLVSIVRSVIRCLGNKNEILENIAHNLGKLVTSTIPAQRAIATAFYAELIGRVDCGTIWLDAIINTLHEAKADSSSLVRKLATIGLTRIAYLEPKQISEYFDNSMSALLDGLEEPADGEGGNNVILESLRGLAILLSIKTERPVSPRVVLALKPFVEKENWEIRLAAISALGAICRGWSKSVESPDDDVTDHLLGCLPCLTIKLEDSNSLVAKAARETLYDAANHLQSEPLAQLIRSQLVSNNDLNIEVFYRQLVSCLKQELPQRADELRNSVVRGYSRSEISSTRATSVLILGLFGQPRPEDVPRMLQLLRDQEPFVKSRAAKALALGFTR